MRLQCNNNSFALFRLIGRRHYGGRQQSSLTESHYCMSTGFRLVPTNLFIIIFLLSKNLFIFYYTINLKFSHRMNCDQISFRDNNDLQWSAVNNNYVHVSLPTFSARRPLIGWSHRCVVSFTSDILHFVVTLSYIFPNYVSVQSSDSDACARACVRASAHACGRQCGTRDDLHFPELAYSCPVLCRPVDIGVGWVWGEEGNDDYGALRRAIRIYSVEFTLQRLDRWRNSVKSHPSGL